MSAEAPEPGPPPRDPAGDMPSDDSQPVARGIAHIERAFLRLTFWQTLLSLAGVFTGAVALYAALNESEAVRKQTAAAVWPYVQFMINDRDDGDSAHFALSFDNVGVGPAQMRSMLLTFDGEALTSWEAVTAKLLGSSAELGMQYGKSSVSRRVLAPGDSVIAFRTDERELALALQEAVYSGSAVLTYCYCSIFEECWQSSSVSERSDKYTDAVETCPSHGERGFTD
jgi:hypothetical protein